MDKLELKHIAPYLPYGLKLYREGFPHAELCELNTKKDYSYWKPILRPLSELTLPQHILGLGFRVLSYDLKEAAWTLSQIEYLYKNHFDVFGLIESGLAVDINTINQ